MRPKILLCDLDGTLIDKAAGFARWADGFAAARGLTSEQRRWLSEADRMHRQREAFFRAVVEGLSLSENSGELWAQYRQQMPHLAPAMPGVVEALAALRDSGWLLAVVSNGSSENQRGKLRASRLEQIFDAVIISEEVGLRKPDPTIFRAAVEACTKQPRGAAWLIGDDPSDDIEGGAAAGLDTVWVSAGRQWRHGGCVPTISFQTPADGLAYLLRAVP
jgi:HAD superfamily hydrolase (TIGR01509 family)